MKESIRLIPVVSLWKLGRFAPRLDAAGLGHSGLNSQLWKDPPHNYEIGGKEQ
jgi:hypothetical protein